VKRALLVGLAGLLFSFSYVAASASAGTPGYLTASYPEAASYEPFTEPPSPTPEPTEPPNTCWDCLGSTYTWAEARVWYCTEERAQQEPSILDECWPEKWEWVCFMEDPARNIKEHCAMYRRDLDPLGIFATPAPMPTPEPLPTPVPTATPDPTPVPDPEIPATATP
jgi:hypothetical protein